ncbi:hypothetical protein LJR129_002486 [Acidovorax sp. LjRoot129]|uniref:hypothetical protein n=1 Tax=Acidovorax sp. LjRoot129 TaxID=3342260 RepID=UPI003ECF1FCE
MALNLAIPGVGSLGFGMGLPPLQLSSSASSGMDQRGAHFGASNGDFIVNMGGSGTSLQGASGGGINWWLIAAGVAAWYFLKK